MNILQQQFNVSILWTYVICTTLPYVFQPLDGGLHQLKTPLTENYKIHAAFIQRNINSSFKDILHLSISFSSPVLCPSLTH